MSPILQMVLDHAIQIIFLIATPVLLSLVRDWMKTRGLGEVSFQVSNVLTDAISYAEQTALAQIRKGADPTPGSEKLQAALSFAQGEVVRLKLPEIASDHLTKMIEARLFIEQPNIEAAQKAAASKTLLPPATQEKSTETIP